ncbi:MAG: FAD-dependent oxidoreductase [Epsilonproteobacteria bacterium]|nr:succinate dehydrogenase [Campylobacterota bacterium]NPA56973.1 FAD-dependent oxidoreductase [Campylobacterota bacterium]
MWDLIVVGSGVAGLSAAIRGRELGRRVVVVAKGYPTQAQTAMAQGGMNAPLSPGDSPERYEEDTLKAGKGIGEREAVHLLAHRSIEAIQWLERLGMPFSRHGNRIAQRRLGGVPVARACYAQDYTGLKLLHTLYDHARKRGVHFLNNHFLLSCIVEGGEARGVTLLDIGEGSVRQLLGSAVVVATGGYAGIYGKFSTNSHGMVGDGIAAVLRAGAKLRDMEFVQFHPTALVQNSLLISEAARGAGGKIINGDGERFVDELTTRDRLARAIYEQLEMGKKVYLDITHLGEDFILSELPQEYRLARLHGGVDPLKEPIPIRPVAHYTMGGIEVDLELRSSIPNLFGVGEVASTGVHGANRLGGNSLMEGVVFGRRAGERASEVEGSGGEREYEETERDRHLIETLLARSGEGESIYREMGEVQELLYRKGGIVREEGELDGALAKVRQCQEELPSKGIGDGSRLYNTDLVAFLEYRNMLDVAEAALTAMKGRRESRGAHYRRDYPEEDRDFQAHSTLWKDNGVLYLDFKRVS